MGNQKKGLVDLPNTRSLSSSRTNCLSGFSREAEPIRCIYIERDLFYETGSWRSVSLKSIRQAMGRRPREELMWKPWVWRPSVDRIPFSSGAVAAAAAATSRQLCPTLCDPVHGSPPPGFSRQEHWSGFFRSTQPFLLRALTEWVSPIHIMKGNLLYSISWLSYHQDI